ncbi:hypothetical protein N1I81_17595 [Bacillus sp. FSL M8-0052]|uniref:hypothetical protein n=1 Tax=Bacillus sp. FSL M8-0052 TaxID=2978203 RepID=UPI0026B09EEC
MDFTYEEAKQSADAQYERKQVILNYALRYYLFEHCPPTEKGALTAERQLQEKACLDVLNS